MRLTPRDVEALQGATLELHIERDLDAFRAAAPRILTQLIPAEHMAWMESGIGTMPSPQSVVMWESPVRTTPKLIQTLRSMVDRHPFMAHAMKTGDSGPMMLSDFWTDRQLVATDFYRLFYQQVGVGRMMTCLSFRGSRFGSLNLTRALKARNFSERDRYVFKLVFPHFLQALATAEQTSARARAQTLVLASQGLTPREIEVALWMAHGRTNTEIATILAMRPRTVEKHVEKVLVKLGVENRTAAATVIAGTVPLGSPPARTSRAAKKPTRL